MGTSNNFLPEGHQILVKPENLVAFSTAEKAEAKQVFADFIKVYDDILSYKVALDDAGYTNDYDHDLFNQATILNERMSDLMGGILSDEEILSPIDAKTEMLQTVKNLSQEITDLEMHILRQVDELGIQFSITETPVEELAIPPVPTSQPVENEEKTAPEAELDNEPNPEPEVGVNPTSETEPPVASEPEANKDKTSTANETSFEADESIEYIAALAQMYKSADKRVFKIPPGNGGQPFKKLKVISDEISLVLNHEGFNSERINHFLNEVVNRIHFDIREDGRLKAKEKNSTKRAELSRNIDKHYQRLLEEVAAFLQTERVDEEIILENSESLDSVEMHIDERIDEAGREYEDLRKKYKESGQKFANSPAIKRIGLILDLIHDNERETDVATSVLKKEKYLKSFLNEIENFRQEANNAKLQEPVKIEEVQTLSVNNNIEPTIDVDEQQPPSVEVKESSPAVNPKQQPVVVEDIQTSTVAEEEQEPAPAPAEVADEVDYSYLGLVADDPLLKDFVKDTSNSPVVEIAPPASVELDPVVVATEVELTPPVDETVVPIVSTSKVVNEATPVAGKTVLEERVTNEYRLSKQESFAAKEDFRKKEKTYQENLKKHYENQSLLNKAFGGTRKIFGLKPKLPIELEKLEAEYKQAKKIYAYKLNEALKMRGLANVGNKEFIAGSDTSKRAFGKKFILNPYQELLSIQESVIASQEAKSRFKRILGLIGKHKKLTRTVGLLAAASIGAAGGGLIGGGLAATRWAVSTFGGATAAGYTAKRMQTGVEKDTLKSQFAKNAALESFTIEDLDNLDSAILNADQEKEIAEMRQKAFVIGTAVAVGGVAGFGTSYIPDMVPNVASSGAGSVAENVPARPGILNGDEVLPTKPNITPIVLKETSIPYHGLNDGSGEYQTVLSDVKIVGEFKADSLTPAQQLELNKLIKLSADDLLSAHPKMSESVLETEIFEKLQNKFGKEVWWKEANVSRVDIGSIEVKPAPGFENPTQSVSEVETVEKVAYEYLVKKDDTLWAIVEKQFSEDLKDLPAAKKMEILDRLFERVEGDPELKASLNLKSGDIDLIYPNEKLNLGGIDKELDKLLGREDIVSEFKRSAPIPVDVDSTTRDIPIKVVEKPSLEPLTSSVVSAKPVAPVIEYPSIAEIQEIAAKEELLANPPRPASVSGNYFENPEYRKYVRDAFGSPKIFERALEKTISSIDNNTYDFFSQGVYESPYGYIKDMTIDELEKFGERPNAEIRAILQVNNIKYDTYLAWLDKVDEMRANLPSKPETKLSDLFSRYVAETQLPRPNNLIRNA
jgi:hypothetical protein